MRAGVFVASKSSELARPQPTTTMPSTSTKKATVQPRFFLAIPAPEAAQSTFLCSEVVARKGSWTPWQRMFAGHKCVLETTATSKQQQKPCTASSPYSIVADHWLAVTTTHAGQPRGEVPQQRSVVGYGGRPTEGSNKVRGLEPSCAQSLTTKRTKQNERSAATGNSLGPLCCV